MTADELKQITEMLGGLSRQIQAFSAKMQQNLDQRADCQASRRAAWEREDREFEKTAREFRRLASFKPGRTLRSLIQNKAG